MSEPFYRVKGPDDKGQWEHEAVVPPMAFTAEEVAAMELLAKADEVLKHGISIQQSNAANAGHTS